MIFLKTPARPFRRASIQPTVANVIKYIPCLSMIDYFLPMLLGRKELKLNFSQEAEASEGEFIIQ
jgi:hypothetical protein